MNQYYTIQITGGTSSGLYSIYYNTIGAGNYALNYPSANIASGLTLAQLNSGTTIQVPVPTTSLYLYNETCGTFQEFIVTPPDAEYPSLCFSVTDLSNLTVTAFTVYYSGSTVNSKPQYSSSGYTVSWNNLGFWDLSGLTLDGGMTVLRSTYNNDIPDSSWVAYGVGAANYSVSVQEGDCGTIISPIVLQVETNNPSCDSETNGSVIATATGGNGSFTYSLDGLLFLNNTGIFTGLSGGTYTVYAKDISGNTTNQSFILNAPTINYVSIGVSTTNQNQLYIVGNMVYYLVQVIYNLTSIPNGITVNANLDVIYDMIYDEPGDSLFDTSLISVVKNGGNFSLSSSASTPFTFISPLPCNRTTYGQYGGSNSYSFNTISLQNTDTLVVNAVYGVDVKTNGGLVDGCLTQAIVNINSNLSIVSYDCNCCQINDVNVTENGLPIIYQ